MSRRALALATFFTLLGIGQAHAQTRVELIGLNDFHGQLASTKKLQGRPAGGAHALAAHLRSHADALIVHAGDWVGASPPESALLQDEPSIELLGLLGNAHCTRANPYHPRCNVVGTLGNHELDEGIAEVLRLLRGGNHARGPFLSKPWRGARVGYVSANVVHARSGTPVLPPFAIKQLAGTRIGVIGATLQEVPSMVVATGVAHLRFLPEAAAINQQARELRKRGVRAIVVTIHQGAPQEPYEGSTRADATLGGAITDIVRALDDDIDVVISGHAHAFTNALVKNASGHEILVTQALSSGQAFASISLMLDAQGEVVSKSAQVIPAYADVTLPPVPEVDALVARASAAVAPLTARVIGSTSAPLDWHFDEAGNSILGNLITDAQREAVHAQVALMNQGGIRSSLDVGDVTWGELFAIEPFSNVVMAIDLRGEQLLRVLEQQWLGGVRLAVSGLRYTFDPRAPQGARIKRATIGDQPLQLNATYRVAVNNFLAEGGDGFSVLREGTNPLVGPVDLDALIAHIMQHGIPSQLEARAVMTR